VRRHFQILSVNISKGKGEQKKPVPRALLKENHGLAGDGHAGKWHRQVSLLAEEDIAALRGRGVDLNYGDFAENITTSGVPLSTLLVGTRLYLGDAVIEVTQIGKKCHHDCVVYQALGDCVMPRKGIFARVLKGGVINRDCSCYYDF
jgi:MOSC domain-containing protein YiiM